VVSIGLGGRWMRAAGDRPGGAVGWIAGAELPALPASWWRDRRSDRPGARAWCRSALTSCRRASARWGACKRLSAVRQSVRHQGGARHERRATSCRRPAALGPGPGEALGPGLRLAKVRSAYETDRKAEQIRPDPISWIMSTC